MEVEQYFNKLNKLKELLMNNKLEIILLEQLLKISDDDNDEINIKIKEIKDLIYKETEEYLEIYKNIRNIINKIDDANEKLFLKYRYILNYSFKEICKKMSYGNTNINIIRIKALEHANKIFKSGDSNG